MRIAKAAAALALTVGVAACQHTGMYPNNDLNEIATLIGSGLGRIEIFTPPTTTYYRRDGAYCEAYRFRQHAYGGPRYGEGTVCHFQNQPWFLATRDFDPVSGSPVPPSHPNPNPHPHPNPPSHPTPHPNPGNSGTGASTGQWVPFNF